MAVQLEWQVPLLAKIPLATTVRETSDSGKPIVLADPDAPASKAFVESAEKLSEIVANLEQEAQPEINF